MRTTDTFENVIGKVHQMSLDHYDEIIPVRDIEFDSFYNMTIGGNEFEVLPSALLPIGYGFHSPICPDVQWIFRLKISITGWKGR